LPDARRWLERYARPGRADLLAWVWDAQDEGAVLLDAEGRIVEANEAACGLLDVDLHAMVGTTPGDRLWRRVTLPDGTPVPAGRRPGAPRPRDAPPLDEQLLAIAAPGRPRRTVRVHSRPRWGDAGLELTLITFIDVTREVAARERVERIAESVQELFFTLRVEDDGALRIVYLGPSVERILGGPLPDDIEPSLRWFLAIHPDDRAIARESVRAATAGSPVDVEYRLRGADGADRWVRVRTQRRDEPDGIYLDGVVADVTADRLGEEEKARFRAVVETSRSCIALLDLDWCVEWINSAGLELTGLGTLEAAVGVPFGDLVGEEARAGHLADERPAVERDGRWTGDSLLAPRRPGARAIPVEATTYRIEHPATGRPLGLACIRRDVRVLRRLSREHEAIGSLATAVASGAEPAEIFTAAAREAAHLLGADAGAVARLGPGGAAPETVGTWHATPAAAAPLGPGIAALGGPAALGRPVSVAVGEEDHCLGVPVLLGGAPWGLVAACRARIPFGPEDERALARLAGLVATAVGVAQARELLVRQATTDGLTGVCNHRAFHDLLGGEIERAHRYDRPVALVLVDLDSFKEVNDRHGHQVGDELLRAVAGALQGVVRASETVARVGGDEFALLLPETDLVGAHATAERVRDAIAALPEARQHGVTASAGVADLSQAATGDELIRLADGALYWSKVHGRNQVSSYDPEHVDELSAAERAERLARTHALGAVRVLARLVDLKDDSTQNHSERVCDLALRLAAELGWPDERRALLRDAALVHDVGKVIVPDGVLGKPGPLTAEEHELVQRHATTGGHIAREALSEEQATWIAQHHERPDGRGYPAGVSGDALTEGARILALADAWEVMTGHRHYRAAKTPEAALAECRALADRQFCPRVLGAFEALLARGAIEGID
jgi:diguanylate cyclase (GGDEF)-like protein/putative nucleotidyltransferase with HDIG domain